MKALLFVLLSISLCACSKNENFFHVDKELEPHYQTFLKEGAARGHKLQVNNLKMVIADIPQDSAYYTTLAYCRLGLTPTVVIDRNYYERSHDFQLDETIFHELGHCIFKLKHNDKKGKYFSKVYKTLFESLPASIMNTFSVSHSLGRYLYQELRPAYLDQLFGLKDSALTDFSDGTSLAERIEDDEMIVHTTKTTTSGCVNSISVEKIENELKIQSELP